MTDIAKARELLAAELQPGTSAWMSLRHNSGRENYLKVRLDQALTAIVKALARPEAVEDGVTQADRDAACPLIPDSDARGMVRVGEWDGHPLVQAFHRHRLGLTSPDRGE